MEPAKKVQVVVLRGAHAQLEFLRLRTHAGRGSFWQNVTGSVEKDETFRKAAARELEEETGLDHRRAHFFSALDFVFTFKSRDQNAQEHCFVAWYNFADLEIIIDPSEHDQFEWRPVNSAMLEDFRYDSNFKALQKATQACAHLFT